MIVAATRRSWSAPTEAARQALAGIGRVDAPLGAWCTYRVGGPAAVLVEADDDGTLDRVADCVAATGVAVLVIGRGSNLLVADRGFDGVVVVLGDRFASIDTGSQLDDTGSLDDTEARDPADRRVVAGGAAALPVVARATVRFGLTGFEWAVGVPGSVGGAVRMNAGGHGADMSDSLVGVEILDLSTGGRSWRSAESLELGYRRSSLRSDEVVLRAELALAPGSIDAGEARLSEIVRWRREHQPGGANAGSVFANPPGDSAGRLIDTAGLKGFRIGSASVSTKHANFVQADPDGSADDVRAVIDAVRTRVAEVHGIRLDVENLLVGFDDSATVER